MGRAGVEPAVEGVGLLSEVDAAAVGADEAVGKEILGIQFEPCVGAALAEDGGHGGDGFFRADGLSAVLAVEHGDREPPVALAGDAPVSALADHGDDAVMAPVGKPRDAVAGADGLVAERLDGTEPLVGGAEYDRLLAAPAVGIGVGYVLARQDGPVCLKVGEDGLVRLENAEALVFAGVGGKAAAGVDVNDHVAAGLYLRILLADHEVVGAVGGCGVDASGTGVKGDVLADDDERGLVEEGMTCGHQLEIRALEDGQSLYCAEAGLPEHGLGEILRHYIDLAVRGLNERVIIVRVEAYGKVARDGPRRRRPNDEVDVVERSVGRELAEIILHAEFDVDGRYGILRVFDLSLREGGLVVRAPVDGLLALVDVALLIHLAEYLDLFGLEFRVHGEIRPVPVAYDAEALELVALDADEVLSEIMARVAELGDRHALSVELLLFDDGGLYRHAVVVPAGGVRRPVARHVLIADDEILEALVESMAHVKMSVRERRTVVQNERRAPLVLLEDLLIETDIVPFLQHVRLSFRKAGTHGEICLRQVDRGVIILRHSLFLFPVSHKMHWG